MTADFKIPGASITFPSMAEMPVEDYPEFVEGTIQCQRIGYVDQYGNFEKTLGDWMIEETKRGVKWHGVYSLIEN